MPPGDAPPDAAARDAGAGRLPSAHYDENLRTAAQAVEQGVVERIQQRAARPTENGIRPGGAATVHPDVASMTRAQREALERRVLHGAQIEL